MSKDWKDRLGIVYSTDPNFQYENNHEEEAETLPPAKQELQVSIDRKQRKGKTVTLVTGFIGVEKDLRELAKKLKSKCGVGGSVKDGMILIQGEWPDKIKAILRNEGYRVR